MSEDRYTAPTSRHDVGEWGRPEGEVPRSVQNPEGNRKAEYVGTPQLSERERRDQEIIRAEREVLIRARPLIREVTQKVRTSPLRVQYIEAIEAAIADVEKKAEKS